MKLSSRNFASKPLFSALLTALIASSASLAFALTPEKTNLVSKIKIEIPYSKKVANNVILISKKACTQLVSEDSKIKVTFDTSVNTLLNTKLYDGMLTFEVDRNSSARIDCNPKQGVSICTQLDSKYLHQTAKQIVVDIPFRKLTGLVDPNACETYNKERFLRGQFRQNASDTTLSLADVQFVIDAVGPPAPTLNSVSATESSVAVQFDTSGEKDTENFALIYSERKLSPGQVIDPSTTNVTYFGLADTRRSNIKVTLEAGKLYHVAIAARDKTGNLGPISNVLEVSPTASKDFWTTYKEAGGLDDGGCSSTPSSPPFSFLFVAGLGILIFLENKKTSTTSKG